MVQATLTSSYLGWVCELPSTFPRVSLNNFSIKRIIYDSLSPKLHPRFRDYPHNASSFWQELHHLFAPPIQEEDSLLSSSDDDTLEEESIVDDYLEESCNDSHSLEKSFIDSLSCELGETSTPKVVH